MFKINDFSFAYPTTDNLISHLYLDISPGQKVVLLGSNGVGKTSILQALWEQSFESTQRVQLSVARAYFTQDVPVNLELKPQKPYLSCYELLLQLWAEHIEPEPLYEWFNHALTLLPPDFKQRLEQNLFEMKLSPNSLAHHYSDLSPGTKKRLLLAILFASNPEVIIADELTNHLDSESIAVLLDWIQASQAAMLLVDHNSGFVSQVARDFLFLPNNTERKVIALPDMSFVQALEYLEELEANQTARLTQLHAKRKQLEAAKTEFQRQAKVFNTDSAGPKIRAVTKRIEREIEGNSLLGELDLKKKVTFQKQLKSGKIKQNLLLEITHLEYLIGQDCTQSVASLKLYAGERYRLMGPNGTGKSTLLQFIKEAVYHHSLPTPQALIQCPQYLSGEVAVSNLEGPQVFLFEQVAHYPNGFSVADYLQHTTTMMPFQIPKFLRKLELDKFTLDSNINHLSMGEFIRLQLGVLAQKLGEIKLLLLDEPGNFLDVFTQKALIELLQSYRGAFILVTHDQVLADKIQVDELFQLLS